MVSSFVDGLSTALDPSQTTGAALFALWAGTFQGRDLTVVSFHGRETISRPFVFDVFVLAPPDTELLDSPLLGQPATLIIQNPGSDARVVQGVIETIEPHGTSSVKGRFAYRLRLVPRLRLLKWRTTSRIFQGMSVPDIVAAVLASAAVPVPASFKLSGTYALRSYCLQHQESDFAFVERLLAEEGIFYFFDHPSGSPDALTGGDPSTLSETVVFIDSADGYPPIAATDASAAPADPLAAAATGAAGAAGASPTLTFQPGEGMRAATDDDVHAFTLKRTMRSNAAMLRDYDYRRPLLDLRAEATIDASDPAAGPAGLRVYAHRGDYDEPDVTPARAESRLDQHRRKTTEGGGETSCRRLLPGHRFTLQADVQPSLAGEYVLTQVDHEGHVPEHSPHGTRTYVSRFRCVPAAVPYRPKRPKPRLRQVLETATVTGPDSADIYTDGYGRIKVQFPWNCSPPQTSAGTA
jgi:type VI secretion system secreted protein VgrG